MHRIETRQIYTTCRGGATSHYPESVVVEAYEPGGRTVEVRGLGGGASGGIAFTIPASYFHATATTTAGRRRITGYYMTGNLDE
ncbi:hypothetical protein ACIRFF_36430 [Streptomyces cyaneofuscatus]